MDTRILWNEYFMMLALAMGYNGAPSGSAHCTSKGFCYPGLSSCTASKVLPSRAVYAEASVMVLRAPQAMVRLPSMNLHCWF